MPSCSAMDLRQLAAVVAIAEHGSFSAAARALHTVQSNISAHVARLERELGVVVFDRGTGRLTEEGGAILQRARVIQRELDALHADVAAANSEVTGSARLGVIGTTARWLVPRLLETMAAAYPRVRVVVVDATTTSLLPQVANGHLDLAVIGLPANDPDVETELLFEEELLVVAPIEHPLAGFERIALPDLADYELLLEPPGTAFRDDLDAEAGRSGVELRSQAEVDGMRLIASLAFEGFGAAILPASALPRWLPAERWRRVEIDGLARRQVGIARRRRGLDSAPTRALREILREVISKQAPNQPGVHAA